MSNTFCALSPSATISVEQFDKLAEQYRLLGLKNDQLGEENERMADEIDRLRADLAEGKKLVEESLTEGDWNDEQVIAMMNRMKEWSAKP